MVTGAIKAKQKMRLFDHQLFKRSTAPSAPFLAHGMPMDKFCNAGGLSLGLLSPRRQDGV